MPKVNVENTENEDVKKAEAAAEETAKETETAPKEKADSKKSNKKGKEKKKKLTPEELLAEKDQEIAALNDKLLRNQAEFENYRKRAFKDLTLARQATKVDTISPVLNVLDTFFMAVQAANSSDNMESIKVGLDMILNEFNKSLDDLGIERIETSKGLDFDHNIHEAVSQEASEEVAEGLILKQWKCGYKLGEYVIRPATVVVSSGKEDESSKEEAE